MYLAASFAPGPYHPVALIMPGAGDSIFFEVDRQRMPSERTGVLSRASSTISKSEEHRFDAVEKTLREFRPDIDMDAGMVRYATA